MLTTPDPLFLGGHFLYAPIWLDTKLALNVIMSYPFLILKPDFIAHCLAKFQAMMTTSSYYITYNRYTKIIWEEVSLMNREKAILVQLTLQMLQPCAPLEITHCTPFCHHLSTRISHLPHQNFN